MHTMKRLTCLPLLLFALLLCGGSARAAPPSAASSSEEPNLAASPSGGATTVEPASSSSAVSVQPASTTGAPAAPASSPSSADSATTGTPATRAPTRPPQMPECPDRCRCTARVADCSRLELAQLPKFDPKSPFVEFIFNDNHLTSVDFKQLPLGQIEKLDLSNNALRSGGLVPAKAKRATFKMLRVLDLSDNAMDSLAPLNSWVMPQLVELNLADNDLVRINASDLSAAREKLERLNLSHLSRLKSIEEGALAGLANLQQLDLSGSLQGVHLADQFFAKNAQLKSLNLSDNDLVEVPFALRSTPGIKRLILNGNLFTSLRRSDFINQQALEHLEVSFCPRLLRVEPDTFAGLKYLASVIISNNMKFFDFSPQAFYSRDSAERADKQPHHGPQLVLLDLTNNSITTMANPAHPPQVQIKEMRLANNPWHCDCSLQWLVNESPNQMGRQPMHCMTPASHKDLEIGMFFQAIDCQLEDSSMQKLVLATFLIFLIVLTLAVFVQKTDLCRRLRWRDQYGTIYYTKASFPTEIGFTTDKV